MLLTLRHAPAIIALTALVLATCPETGHANAPPAMKLWIRDSGVYRVSHADLVEAGWPRQPQPTATLHLDTAGAPVPLHVGDGGDGTFDAGDWIEFVGHRLAGEGKHFHEHSPVNVYWLRATPDHDAVPMRARAVPPSNDDQADNRHASRLRRQVHLEEDRLLIRLAPPDVRGEAAPETWYWHKITQADPAAVTVPVELPGWSADDPEPVHLRLRVRGLSRTRSGGTAADHDLEVALNGTVVAKTTWSGKLPHDVAVDDLTSDHIRSGTNELAIRVRPRSPSADANAPPLVDIVMLDWIALDYPHSGRVPAGQTTILAEAATATTATLTGDAATFVAYGEDGSRTALTRNAASNTAVHYRLPLPAGTSVTHLVADNALAHVAGIAAAVPSNLRATSTQADYLIIAHQSLTEALGPLAAFHERRGLAVAIADVERVFDEFTHGVLDPRAIDAFIAYTHTHWTAPAPRFVLLVGDASWDTKNTTGDTRNYAPFVDKMLERGAPFLDRRKHGVPMYDAIGRNERNLVPTMTFQSSEGHAASDHFFADVDADGTADVAIGRFPVTTPEEVTAIVRKSLAYAKTPPPGPWRRNVLWITNEEQRYQVRTEQLHDTIADRGFAETFVYPQVAEADNRAHQSQLVDAFDEGQLLVHFLGHGGRHIWRTGPPDFKKNHDLFTMEHLDQLQKNPRQPIVLSLTCFSAPFDHPTADSIGEKFLRLPERGAVAVIGASWRNDPAQQLSKALIEQLSRPTTVGEAFVAAKRGLRDRENLYTYNLLGDPALPVPVPATRLQLVRDDGARADDLRVTAPVESAEIADGVLLVEWLDEYDEVVHSERPQIREGRFSATAPKNGLARIRAVRAYAWNPKSGRDAIGYLRIETRG